MDMPFEQRYVKVESRPLGEGTYGEVYKVRNCDPSTYDSGSIYAMKRMKLAEEEEGVPSTVSFF